MELALITQEGTATGKTVLLAETVFNIEPNNHAMYLDVKQFLANQRQGTHKVKGRGEVSGSTKKPFKQKGTGNARQGHKRSPLFRHGGTVHGPEPRDYGFKLNRKVKQLARRSALTYKTREQAITVLDTVQFETPKTKLFIEMLNKIGVTGKKLLFITGNPETNVYRSGRNLDRIHFAIAGDLNTYDILNADHVVMDAAAVELVNQSLS
jgi:large subunit ribosomal protein L4